MGGWCITIAASLAGAGEPSLASDDALAMRGEDLIARLGCTTCHTASEAALARIAPERAPELDGIGARRAPAALRRFLLDPHGEKADNAMPDVLAHLRADEREATADALAHFLASLGGPLELGEIEVEAGEIERGRQLYHSVGCVACHAPQESADDLESPIWAFKLDLALAPNVVADLGHPAFATTIDALAALLLDPPSALPSGRMPSMRLDPAEARAIAAYLLRDQARSIEELDGWRSDYYEGRFESADARALDALDPVETLVIDALDRLPNHREDQFAFRWRGFVDAPDTGGYEFFTKSDDGSRLYVDGALVVNNDGDHAPQERGGHVWLERGLHSLVATMYENAGGQELSVSWRPPRGEKGVVPPDAVRRWRVTYAPDPTQSFALDAAKVARGRREFEARGCAICHPLEGVVPASIDAPPLETLAPRLDAGCLADEPNDGAPRFDLSAADRDALRIALSHPERLSASREPHAQLAATLQRFNCLACHTRGGAGGPSSEVRAYFKGSVEVDLGNEGRLPPSLDDAGAKLHADWIAKALRGETNERPYLATRMPVFGEEHVGGLAQLFEGVDGSPGDLDAPPFSSEAAENGRRLAGANGLGCIQCHLFNGVESQGIPAVDLARVAERIKPAWFRELLLDPKSLGMNSRMPVFWDQEGVSAARDMLGGDPQKQADALWSYVSLGGAMPFPDGLIFPESEYELVPASEPILCSVFFEGASARTMLVGTPQRVHFAFDVENSRLVCAWRGRFYNAKGTWHARAGKLERPPSDDVLELPKLAPIAILPSPDAPWPPEIGRDAGFVRLGWKLDASGLPGFRYAHGDVTVLERVEPLVRAGTTALRRTLTITSPRARDDIWLLGVDGVERTRVELSRSGGAESGYSATVTSEVSW